MVIGREPFDDALVGSMIRTVLFLLAALGVAEGVEACTCAANPSPCARFRSADVVFVGRILEATVAPDSDVTTIRMTVLRAGKGLTRGRVIEVQAGDARSTCSFDVLPGERWMIYAQREAGVLKTHKCSGTQLTVGEPLPSLPPEPGSVAGVATTENDQGEETGLADVEVVIDTGGRRLATRTSRDGRFLLRNVPAGRHTVRVDVPPAQSAEADVWLASARECAYEHLSAGPGGGVVGRLVEASGAPLPHVFVRARAVEADGILPEHAGDAFDRTRANGEFRLVGLAPGDYVVDVGYGDPPTGRLPYRHTFYPDAAEPARARAIRVDGRLVELEPFVLSSPVPVVNISAEIVCRDGTRPTGGAVEISRLDGTAESDYATTSSAGLYAVRVVRGLRYRVTGFLEGRWRAPNGSVGPRSMATASLETGSDTDVGPLRLVADAERCDAPGGPWIDR